MNTSAYWSDQLEGFVRYFERHTPWLPQAIAGASAARIEHAQRLAGTLFPPEYRAFLQTLGETRQGGLGPFLEHMKFGMDALEEFYSQPGLRPPRHAVFLWTYEFDAPYDIFLETQGGERDVRGLLQAGWSVDEDTGALLEEEPTLMPLDGSLLRFLYTEAFLKLRNPLLPHSLQLRDRRHAEESVAAQLRLRNGLEETAARFGFTAVPYADGNQVLYDRVDASLMLYAQPGANVVYVSSADERELGLLGEVLRDKLDLALWR
ncbi:SMI1/KNR4 family protein [Pyxidicoccus xibeiensis]|uniref:SMI1/KNR4 family protein n=1 Tax=Pyxidicoccus xibeiensis TaxID=2906759 RepID=UPI0020A81797|nr:SMI1/KNR4 family protein [Pyxidicoccus xibeiensis]MCP3140527.1 SMI1/KNR4 family protein [Pyxidicoccus xibeiensis]